MFSVYLLVLSFGCVASCEQLGSLRISTESFLTLKFVSGFIFLGVVFLSSVICCFLEVLSSTISYKSNSAGLIPSYIRNLSPLHVTSTFGNLETPPWKRREKVVLEFPPPS